MKVKPAQQERKKLIRRLRSHYKLVLLNIDNFEERFSVMLTPMNVIVLGGTALMVIIALMFFLLAWTPLRFYLPGYGDEVRIKKMALDAALTADSLELSLQQRDMFIDNLRQVIEGDITVVEAEELTVRGIDLQKVEFTKTPEDSLLRAEIEKEDFVNLLPNFNRDSKSSYLLFPPIQGTITDKFNIQRDHFGVDIAAPKDATIKAIDEGTVVMAAYTAETGYVIQVQHDNDLISVYKHNSVLLKKQGESVRAGEALAIIGETGEYSTGPHLHFEMWRKGVPLNPETFFSFK